MTASKTLIFTDILLVVLLLSKLFLIISASSSILWQTKSLTKTLVSYSFSSSGNVGLPLQILPRKRGATGTREGLLE